jgi:transposase
MTKSTGQNWPAYNAAQTNEKARFLALLRKLCDGVTGPLHTLGRPPAPLGDVLFAMVYRVYGTFSCRRGMSDLKVAQESELISKLPRPSTILKYFDMKAMTPYLRQLIVESSLPLRDVETAFAVDSSGFSTSCFGRWVDKRFGKAEVGEQRVWVKAHIMCGVLTNIVTAVEVSDANAADSPFFLPLVKVTLVHFWVKEVSADKAYSSLKNLRFVRKVKGMPFIPFKVNTNPMHKTKDPLWTRLYHFYSLNKEWFNAHYHKRSNVEATFSMIKAKFRGHLRSRSKTAQVNEVLCKILCHNLCVIIQSMYELGIEPNFWREESDRAKVS